MLAWMDLEMTGLDPEIDVILEVATIITDDDLNIVAEGPDIVIHAETSRLRAMDPFVQRMHSHSGLFKACEESTLSSAHAAAETLAFLRTHIPEERTVPLCGNSIGTDRRFLAQHWPEIENFLHYRSIDVSTVKELARRWNAEVFASAPTKATAHRALDDIKESISELRYYRDAFFHQQKTSGPSK